MPSNTVYHYTFTYDAPGGGDKGGAGDYYKGWTADMNGVYQQGQTIKTEYGTYKIDAVQAYNYDLDAEAPSTLPPAASTIRDVSRWMAWPKA